MTERALRDLAWIYVDKVKSMNSISISPRKKYIGMQIQIGFDPIVVCLSSLKLTQLRILLSGLKGIWQRTWHLKSRGSETLSATHSFRRSEADQIPPHGGEPSNDVRLYIWGNTVCGLSFPEYKDGAGRHRSYKISNPLRKAAKLCKSSNYDYNHGRFC